MKLRNKKTGEIREIKNILVDEMFTVNSLAELNEEWEDYEEPKVGYIIDPMDEDYISADNSGYEESDIERAKELGIWLETEEEAKKAVEKLKAWKRLKDKGFRFTGLKKIYQGRSSSPVNYTESPAYISFNKATEDFVSPTGDWVNENWYDLQLLFGGEDA